MDGDQTTNTPVAEVEALGALLGHKTQRVNKCTVRTMRRTTDRTGIVVVGLGPTTDRFGDILERFGVCGACELGLRLESVRLLFQDLSSLWRP